MTRAAYVFFLFALLTLPTLAPAADPPLTIPESLVRERFSVARGGDFLLVPVAIGGRDCTFLVDTGFTLTTLEASLLPGRPRERLIARGPDGDGSIDLFDPPEARVGGSNLRQLPVVGRLDLTAIREASGYPIDGILGMDFLGRHVVHIDFDRGELVLLRAVPGGAGEAVPLEPDDEMRPTVLARHAGFGPTRFAVDTGCNGLMCGSVTADLGRDLVRAGGFRAVSACPSVTVTGVSRGRILQGKELMLGGFAVRGPAFRECVQDNLLGLGFWSRFVVTFDFPGGAAYLRKGKNHDRPERWPAAGLRYVRRNGAVVVETVDADGPAAAAGFRKGDVLVLVGGLNANESSFFELSGAMHAAERVECVVRRGQTEHRLTLSVPGASAPSVTAGR